MLNPQGFTQISDFQAGGVIWQVANYLVIDYLNKYYNIILIVPRKDIFGKA